MLHRSHVHSTKPTEGDSGPRVGVMSALTETNKVRGQKQRQSVRGHSILTAELNSFSLSAIGNIRENPIDVSLRSKVEIYIHSEHKVKCKMHVFSILNTISELKTSCTRVRLNI